MLLVGDVSAIGYPKGLGYLLEHVKDEFQASDLVYGNLEFPITDRGEFDMSKHWKVPLAMKPDDAGVLAKAGVGVMSVATNHIMDFGVEGLFRTLELLDANGIKHCGAGKNRREAHKAVLCDVNGNRIAFLAYTSVFAPTGSAGEDKPGMATVQVKTAFMPDPRIFEQPGTPPAAVYQANAQDVAAMKDDVMQAKSTADVVVVAWHWGVSASKMHASYQTELGRAAIDAGASIVIGHHSHILHGVEAYKNGLIFYSLGDFVCWSGEAPGETHEKSTVIVECDIEGGLLSKVSLLPVFINDSSQPEPAKADGRKVLQGLLKSSKDLGTQFSDEGARLVLNMPAAR